MTPWEEIEQLLRELEQHQAHRVLALARRLRPGLTLEDTLNPHDFPELDDLDWQFECGTLSGIQAVAAAVRSRMRNDGNSR